MSEQALDTLSRTGMWVARNIIANELHFDDEPLPLRLRPHVAQALVDDEELGWPSLEDAQGTLDEWRWE